MALWLLLTLPAVCTAASWDYDTQASSGPHAWGDMYPACNGQQQSPININTANTEMVEMEPIEVVNFHAAPRSMRLHNNGHALVVDLDADMKVRGGNLTSTYQSAQFHFHWGKTNSRGSEHTLNGDMYPLEVHIVNWNTDYADISTAISQPDGLAVLGVFFELSDDDNAVLDKMLDHVAHIKYKGNATILPTTFAVQELLPICDGLGEFYRYQGSLTTPQCQESVTWTVFKKMSFVSSRQMDKFRSMRVNGLGEADKELSDNYRPVQNLNGRTVYESHGVSLIGSVSLLMAVLLKHFI